MREALEVLDAVQLVGCSGYGPTFDQHLAEQEDGGEQAQCQALRVHPRAARKDTLIRWCTVDSAGAAWALRVSRRDLERGEYKGTWQLLRLGQKRDFRVSRKERYRGLEFNAHVENAPPDCPAFFDYDADGSPEAIVLGREAINNAAAEKRVLIYTVRAGVVVRYRPTRALVAFGVADLDGDGRPDLVVNPYARTSREPAVVYYEYPRHSSLAWGLVARSEERGGFSLTSDLTRQAAALLCPSHPGDALPGEPSEWPAYLHCARLWGEPSEELEARVREACGSAAVPDRQTWCKYSRDLLRTIARSRLPFALPAVP